MATQVISMFGRITLIDNFSGPLNRAMVSSVRSSALMKNGLLAIGVAVAATAAISVTAATSFESSFTGIRKTVDETEENFQKLRKGILDMAKDSTNPVAGLPNAQKALAGIMEQAGQLGIRGVDNLLKFTETVAKLSLATNLGSDAALKLSQFLNITGEETQNIDRIAATIVELGNNLATTEDAVLQMAMRIAGAGTVAGLSSQQILALSGAAASLGLRAQMGGSAISRIFNQMAEAIGKGGDGLTAFAKTAGLSTAAFTRLFKDNPIEAFNKTVQGLGKLDATQQAGALDDMSLSGIRVSDALRRLSLDIGGVTEALGMADAAYEENNAHNVEAQRRLETTAAQWNVLKNTIRDVFITIGDRLLPAVNVLISGIQGFLVGEGFTAWLDNVLDKAGRIAPVLGEVARQVGGVLGNAIDAAGNLIFGDNTLGLTDTPTDNTIATIGPTFGTDAFDEAERKKPFHLGDDPVRPQSFFSEDPTAGATDSGVLSKIGDMSKDIKGTLETAATSARQLGAIIFFGLDRAATSARQLGAIIFFGLDRAATTARQIGAIIFFGLDRAATSARQLVAIFFYGLNEASKFAAGLWEGFLSGTQTVVDVVIDIIEVLKDSWRETKKAAVRVWEFIGGTVTLAVEGMATFIKVRVGQAWEAIKIVANLGFDNIKTTADATISLLDGWIRGLTIVWDLVKDAAMGAFNWLQDNSDTILTAVTDSVGFIADGFNSVKTAAETAFTWISEHIPDLSALGDFFSAASQVLSGDFSVLDPRSQGATGGTFGTMGSMGNKKGGGGGGQKSAKTVNLGAPILGSGGRSTFSFKDAGGPGFANQPVLIGPTAGFELFNPSSQGNFIPNMENKMGGGGGINIGQITINANSEAEGRAAGRGFSQELMDYAARQGYTVTGLTG